MRCPACGARNPSGAAWCGQCFTAFDGSASSTTTPETAQRQPAVGRAAERLASSRHFRRRDGDLEWRCRSCGTWNHLAATTCASCRSPFGEALGLEPPRPRRDVARRVALAATVVLPGGGHLLAGRTATGAARALTYLVWLVGGGALLRAGLGTHRSVLPAVPLLAGAVTIWALSLRDVLTVLDHEDHELLTPRVLLWTVVGVLLALIASFLPSVL